MSDFKVTGTRNIWAWRFLALASAGIVLSYRHHGSPWKLVLAAAAVLVSGVMVYWSTRGVGAVPLRNAVSRPAAPLTTAIVLTLGARVIVQFRPGRRAGDGNSKPGSAAASAPTPALLGRASFLDETRIGGHWISFGR